MKKVLLSLFLVLFGLSGLCQISEREAGTLDSLWQVLVFKRGGCLTGGQIVKNGTFGNATCAMSDFPPTADGWDQFFHFSKETLTTFLLNKLSDLAKTRIHTCTCDMATEGEVAVYALHRMYRINWFELAPFIEFKHKESTACDDNYQSWLREILADTRKMERMRNAWRARVKD